MDETKTVQLGFELDRLPPKLQTALTPLYTVPETGADYLPPNAIYQGDARDLLPQIAPGSVALSVWSPPYFVGKNYEAYLDFDAWQALLARVIELHFPIIRPGGFLRDRISEGV